MNSSLKGAGGLCGVVEEHKEGYKAHQLHGIVDARRNAGQDHLPAVPPLARFLCVNHRPQARAGDEFHPAHIKHDFESAGVVDGLKSIGQLRRGIAIDTTGCFDEIAALQLAGGDFPCLTSWD